MGNTVVVVAVVAAALILQAFAANKMQEIAEKKGNYGRYWAWCFWFPIAGYAMVIALPDERIRKNQDKIVALLTEMKDQGAASADKEHSLIEQYQKAEALLTAGDYDSAEEMFFKLGSFRDSAEKMIAARKAGEKSKIEREETARNAAAAKVHAERKEAERKEKEAKRIEAEKKAAEAARISEEKEKEERYKKFVEECKRKEAERTEANKRLADAILATKREAEKHSQDKIGLSMEGDAFEGQDLAARNLKRCPKCGAVQTNKRQTCYQCDTLLV